MSPSTASRAPRFSVTDDPWVDVRRATTYFTVGLRELFLSAHTYDDLATAMAPGASSLLRMCAAISARITNLDDADLTADQWNARRRQAFTRGSFDPEAVHAYFDDPAYCFEVFDPDRPFLQEPLLAEQCPYPSGINKLVWGRPAGNNLAWLSPHHDRAPVPIRTGQALLHLLTHHYYGSPGTYTPRSADGRPASGRGGSSGPLRSTVSFHPLGRSLFETLLAQIPKFTGHPTPPDPHSDQEADRCPWESPWRPGPFQARPHLTWPGRLLTGRSRHAVLLVPTADGAYVENVYLTWGDRLPPLPATDPYLVMHTAADGRRADKRRLPRRADADRAWWRELEALLLAPDENRSLRRPEIFDTLNDLPPDVRTHLRVRIHGFDQETGKTKDFRWYTAITPPLLAWAQENDPQRAERIGECVQEAERTVLDLEQVAHQAWKDTIDGRQANNRAATAKPKATKKPSTPWSQSKDIGSQQAKKFRESPWKAPACTLYWQLAQDTFWRLLDTPEQCANTAFAATAASALRQATATDRIRYRHAARAIATAVSDLHRLAQTRRSARER